MDFASGSVVFRDIFELAGKAAQGRGQHGPFLQTVTWDSWEQRSWLTAEGEVFPAQRGARFGGDEWQEDFIDARFELPCAIPA